MLNLLGNMNLTRPRALWGPGSCLSLYEKRRELTWDQSISWGSSSWAFSLQSLKTRMP